MRLLTVPALGLCFLASPAVAQTEDGFHLQGSIRLRVETIDGQARAGTRLSETLTELRTILQSRYKTGPLTIGIDLYDGRAIEPAANTAATTNEINALEPVQIFASLAIGDAKTSPLHGRVTIGRQTVDVQSRRLIANDDYRNTTNGFTGIRVDLAAKGGWDATAYYLLPQQRLPDDLAGLRRAAVELDHEGFDTRLWGATLGKKLTPRIALDGGVYRFEERDRPDHATRNRQLTTLTARAFAPQAPGKWDFEVEAMRQAGSIAASLAPTAATLSVKAYFAHAEAGYQWSQGWKPHLVMETDYASGDKRDGTYRRFDTLYGARRSDYSPAGLYNAVTRSNLIAVGPRLEVTPSDRLDAFVTIKKLWLSSAIDSFAASGVVDPTGLSGRDAGWQTDARVRLWAIPKRLLFEADGVWLAKGRFLETAPNRASNNDTLYLSLNATAFF
jgi:hypothetical protein